MKFQGTMTSFHCDQECVLPFAELDYEDVKELYEMLKMAGHIQIEIKMQEALSI